MAGIPNILNRSNDQLNDKINKLIDKVASLTEQLERLSQTNKELSNCIDVIKENENLRIKSELQGAVEKTYDAGITNLYRSFFSGQHYFKVLQQAFIAHKKLERNIANRTPLLVLGSYLEQEIIVIEAQLKSYYDDKENKVSSRLAQLLNQFDANTIVPYKVIEQQISELHYIIDDPNTSFYNKLWGRLFPEIKKFDSLYPDNISHLNDAYLASLLEDFIRINIEILNDFGIDVLSPGDEVPSGCPSIHFFNPCDSEDGDSPAIWRKQDSFVYLKGQRVF